LNNTITPPDVDANIIYVIQPVPAAGLDRFR
jgi:hypothetical protein